MKAEIVTFPRGGAEGLPVIRLDCEGEPFEGQVASAHVARIRCPGAWAVWLDRVADWSDASLTEYLTASTQTDVDGHPRLPVVGIRVLGSRDWPAYGAEFVLDASAAFSECKTVEALARFLGKLAHSFPRVETLAITVRADQLPPRPAMLDMLHDVIAPFDVAGYMYLPTDYQHRALMLRTVSECASSWALRVA